MRNGFPDYHQFPDRDHGDESFWPSFTDIMMVITMVFLLVTVMAITNNWKLVTDLKSSIQAERLAAEQALDQKAENNSLEDQMVMLQRRLVDANKVAVDKQVANQVLQDELTRILTRVTSIEKELEASLSKVREREKQLELTSQQVSALKADRDKQLATLATRAQALNNLQGIQETSQQQVIRLQAALDQKQAELLASQQEYKTVQSELSAAAENVLQQQAALKAEQLAAQKQQAALQESGAVRDDKIATLEKALERANTALLASQQDSNSQLVDLQEKLRLSEASLDTTRASQQDSNSQLIDLQEKLRLSEASLDTSQASQQDSDTQLTDLKERLRQTEAALEASRTIQQDGNTQLTALQANLQQTLAQLGSSQESQQLTAKQLEAMRAEVIALEVAKRNETVELEAMRAEMAQLQDLRSQDETKLESLKSEFDSLDTKYQKLVRPARSSSGKHVVSVWFSKQGGREVYRIRDSAQGSFATTTRRGMANTLAALKNKHGKNLYVKVIIPENSGLSYSDAWRFTTEMQRAYDYYYQDNE